MGPMVQQIQSQCRECGGEGETWAAKDKCPDCKGKKVGRGTNIYSELNRFFIKYFRKGDSGGSYRQRYAEWSKDTIQRYGR